MQDTRFSYDKACERMTLIENCFRLSSHYFLSLVETNHLLLYCLKCYESGFTNGVCTQIINFSA